MHLGVGSGTTSDLADDAEAGMAVFEENVQINAEGGGSIWLQALLCVAWFKLLPE